MTRASVVPLDQAGAAVALDRKYKSQHGALLSGDCVPRSVMYIHPGSVTSDYRRGEADGQKNMSPEEALKEAIRRAGGAVAVARHFGINHAAVSRWRVVPGPRAIPLEKLTGVARHELRPDLYPRDR
jgi:hypothetical protein